MEEVPGSEESLLVLDEQPALTGQNEERLLIRLGVIDAALTGLEDGQIDPELRELDRTFAVLVGEPTRRAPRLRREPFGIAHVDDEPTPRDGGKPGAGVLEPRFGHDPILTVQATSLRTCGNVTRACEIRAIGRRVKPAASYAARAFDEPDEEGWIVARVVELPGALSQGRTREEA